MHPVVPTPPLTSMGTVTVMARTVRNPSATSKSTKSRSKNNSPKPKATTAQKGKGIEQPTTPLQPSNLPTPNSHTQSPIWPNPVIVTKYDMLVQGFTPMEVQTPSFIFNVAPPNPLQVENAMYVNPPEPPDVVLEPTEEDQHEVTQIQNTRAS